MLTNKIIIFCIFIIGLSGLWLNRNHILLLIISLEIMFLAINVIIVLLAVELDLLIGYIFIIFILTIAAVEVAVGLALIININRLRGGISMDMIQLLKK